MKNNSQTSLAHEALANDNLSGALDRVLLYARGLDLSPELSLDLARETLDRLRSANQTIEPKTAMEEFRRLLNGRCQHPDLPGWQAEPLTCAPPLNKRHMLAEDMDGSIVKGLLRLCRLSSVRTKPAACK